MGKQVRTKKRGKFEELFLREAAALGARYVTLRALLFAHVGVFDATSQPPSLGVGNAAAGWSNGTGRRLRLVLRCWRGRRGRFAVAVWLFSADAERRTDWLLPSLLHVYGERLRAVLQLDCSVIAPS